MAENVNTEVKQSEYYRKRDHKQEMRKQLISFGLMIFFTIIAFGLVAVGNVGRSFIVPALFVMAIVQAGFQFFYFMHLKDKGHEMPTVLILGGVWAAFLTLAGLMTISWW